MFKVRGRHTRSRHTTRVTRGQSGREFPVQGGGSYVGRVSKSVGGLYHGVVDPRDVTRRDDGSLFLDRTSGVGGFDDVGTDLWVGGHLVLSCRVADPVVD